MKLNTSIFEDNIKNTIEEQCAKYIALFHTSEDIKEFTAKLSGLKEEDAKENSKYLADIQSVHGQKITPYTKTKSAKIHELDTND